MSAKREKKKRRVEKAIYKSNLFMWESIKPPKWRFIRYRKWLKLKPKPPKVSKQDE